MISENHAVSDEWEARKRPTEHLYVSTACQHGHHDYCQREAGATGQKIPAQCKFCAAPCLCPCHGVKP